MTILIGIIVAHFIVIFRAKQLIRESLPHITIFVSTLFMVVYVVIMMYTMKIPG
jgi:hypothetical protein